MRRGLILATLGLLSLQSVEPRQTAGQEIAASVPTYKVAWTHKTAVDGRDHLWQYVTYVPESGQLLAVEKSLDTTAMRDGRFVLSRFAADGQVISSSRIDQRPAELVIGPSPNDILGVFPLEQEEVLVVGVVDKSEQIVFIRLDRQGNRLRSKSLGKGSMHFFSSAVLKSKNSLLLVGGSHPDALAVETDLEGNILWKQKYQTQARFKRLETAVVNPDGKSMLLVGRSGDWNKFGAGPTDVWLLRCDAGGKLLDEQMFSGHPICLTGFGGNKLALLHGKKSWLEYAVDRGKPPQVDRMIISSDLKTLSDNEMDFVALPAMSQTASDRFVLAGLTPAPIQSLQVREYNAGGQLTRQLDRPWDRTQDGGVAWIYATGGPNRVFTAINTLHEAVGKLPVIHGVLLGLHASDN